METQEISAPADGLTTETPKRRQVGYGLPCAKCHKYFPADLELCPICKGRERVSPVVAPRIPKPVRSETSVAPSSSAIALKQEVKESTGSESPALASPIEIKVKDHPLDHKESITIPAVAETQAALEPAQASLASTQTVLIEKEKESPKPESSAVAPPVEVNEDVPLNQKESIAIPAVAETQAAAEPALASLVSTPEEKESPKSESPAVICLKDQSNNNLPGQEEHFAIPAFVEAQASDPVPTAIVPMRKEEERTTELDAPASAVPMHTVVADQQLAERRRDRINEALRIVIPMLLEDRAAGPVPAGVVSKLRAGELPSELESATIDFPKQIGAEERDPDPTSHEDPIVIPTLIETQACEPVPVAAERQMEQKEKAEAPEMLETPKSTSEVKVADVGIGEVKIVESPAVFDQANHPTVEEKSKVVDGSDATPKPPDVNAPVMVHVNLGELRSPRGAPEHLPAPEQLKEPKSTKPEIRSSDIPSDTYASEPPAPVSSHRFDLMAFALSVVVLACAVLLITLAVIRLMPHHASASIRRAKAAYSSAPPTADQNVDVSIPTPPPTAAVPENSAPSDSSPVVAPAVVPGQPPAASSNNLLPSAGSEQVLTLSPDLAEGNLLYRIEPDYPEEARRQGVQGPVVLDLHISKEGLVQGVALVSGQPLLAQAATAAVKQWRFRTRYLNGYETEMQARITLHFALPTP